MAALNGQSDNNIIFFVDSKSVQEHKIQHNTNLYLNFNASNRILRTFEHITFIDLTI